MVSGSVMWAGGSACLLEADDDDSHPLEVAAGADRRKTSGLRA
jgi:hypothetical protein